MANNFQKFQFLPIFYYLNFNYKNSKDKSKL